MRFLWLKCVFVVKNAFFKKWSEVGKMGKNGGKKPGAKSPIPYYGENYPTVKDSFRVGFKFFGAIQSRFQTVWKSLPKTYHQSDNRHYSAYSALIYLDAVNFERICFNMTFHYVNKPVWFKPL